MDGTVWDGKDPKTYAAGFKIKASTLDMVAAVFIRPRRDHARGTPTPGRGARSVAAAAADTGAVAARAAPKPAAAADWRASAIKVLPPLLGIALVGC